MPPSSRASALSSVRRCARPALYSLLHSSLPTGRPVLRGHIAPLRASSCFHGFGPFWHTAPSCCSLVGTGRPSRPSSCTPTCPWWLHLPLGPRLPLWLHRSPWTPSGGQRNPVRTRALCAPFCTLSESAPPGSTHSISLPTCPGVIFRLMVVSLRPPSSACLRGDRTAASLWLLLRTVMLSPFSSPEPHSWLSPRPSRSCRAPRRPLPPGLSPRPAERLSPPVLCHLISS